MKEVDGMNIEFRLSGLLSGEKSSFNYLILTVSVLFSMYLLANDINMFPKH